jgi:hypothetical protein
VAVARALEEATEAGVADLARGSVPFGLLMVAAEDVASAAHGHRLGLVVDLVTALGDGQRHARRGVGEDDLTDHLVGALARAEQIQQVALLQRSGGRGADHPVLGLDPRIGDHADDHPRT